jgi:hypothetical protein
MMADWPGHKFAAAFAGIVLVLWVVVMAVMMRWAALPPEAPGPLLAVFEPGMSEEEMFARIIAANGKPLRGTWLGFVWIVAGEEEGLAGRLEGQGAIGTLCRTSLQSLACRMLRLCRRKGCGGFFTPTLAALC